MKDLTEKIYSILKDAAVDLGAKDVPFSVEVPKEKTHGDLASNISLALSKTLKKSPMELADLLVAKISKHKDIGRYFEKVEVVAPGFINFYFSQKYLSEQVGEIINQGLGYGSSEIGKGKSVSVEYISANPTGPLHIGNARGGPIGDTIANVYAKAGYKVIREYLHNDVGGQITKLGEAIYYTLHPDEESEEEIQYQGEYIKELANQVGKEISSDLSKKEFIEKAASSAVEILLKEILEDSKSMGISFDKVTKESDLRKQVPKVLEKIKSSLKEKDGAVWFAPNDEFLKDRETVVKKSNGEFTYFASDIAYHNEKMINSDTVIDILGSNHSGHVPRLQAIIKALKFDTSNFKFVLYQYVRLKRGGEVVKMSKRAGNFVTAREVLDEVGKDAFRFFLLTPRSQTHMDFDLQLAKEKSADNPVFYIQYAYSRICSVFKKTGEEFKTVDLDLLTSKEEIDLIRNLIFLPSLVEQVTKTLEVNAFCAYAVELATSFHKFYEVQRIISEDKNLTKARLALLKATQITLKNTLDLLGVSAPESM